MQPLSPFRLNLLRLGYAIIGLGLCATIWPAILDPAHHWAPMNGVVTSMLGALGLLALLGLRHPLAMLPLMLFELGWKIIWLLRIALPLYASDQLDGANLENALICLPILAFIPIIPWRHVWHHYVIGRAEAWR